MTLEEFGIIGEIAASVATVITLAYLAIQIRTSNKVQLTESRRAVQSMASEFSAVIGSDKDAAKVFNQGLLDFDGLPNEEKTQFVFLLSMLVGQANLAHTDSRLGLVDWAIFESSCASAFRMLKLPGGRRYWEAHGGGFTPDFQEYVNQQVLEN